VTVTGWLILKPPSPGKGIIANLCPIFIQAGYVSFITIKTN